MFLKKEDKIKLMKKIALSVKNPYSYLICSGAKRVENRTWKTDYRGRVYIHSSGGKNMNFVHKSFLPDGLLEDTRALLERLGDNPTEAMFEQEAERLGDTRLDDCLCFDKAMGKLYDLYRRAYGENLEQSRDSKKFALVNFAIIGHVDLVDIIQDFDSGWAESGCYHWILDNPVLYDSPAVNVKGALRLFDISHVDLPDD